MDIEQDIFTLPHSSGTSGKIINKIVDSFELE